MKNATKSRFWVALVIFSLIGQIAWVIENMYFNVFIYKMFNADAAAISAMVSASATAATLTTVFVGALSDKIGKRKLFICGGYILWGISISAFSLLRLEVISALFPAAASAAAVGVSLVIVLDCVMTFFGSSANDACFNAWLTDSTESGNRGAAEGVNSMMPLIAILAVFGGFMAFDLDKAESWTAIFLIIGVTVTVIGLLGIWLIKDAPHVTKSEGGVFANVFYGFRPSVIKVNPLLYFALGGFALFGISIQIFMPYLIIYYESSLQMSDYVLIMAPAIIIASIVTAFYGRVYDKVGFGKAIIAPMAMLGIGYVLLFIFKTTLPVFVGSLFMMCGYLTGAAVFGAVIRDCTPVGKSGRFQGLRIVAQVLIPGVVGPAISKEVLKNAQQILNSDGTYSFLPNKNIFLAALIAAAVVCIYLAFYKTVKKAPAGEVQNG